MLLPTTLLSSMLDPRTAMSRRYSESNVLRGGDRLAQLNASGDEPGAAGGTLPLPRLLRVAEGTLHRDARTG